MLNNEKKPESIIMIVNGQPVEVCLRTLNVCNKRAQNFLRYLKKQSLEKVHTMRFFWGDVIMLNMLTNQLLQKVNYKSLSRVLKPTVSLKDDLEEYREHRKVQVENLKDALIMANDKMLPLDYSRELEKYYKKVSVDEDAEKEKELTSAILSSSKDKHSEENSKTELVSEQNTTSHLSMSQEDMIDEVIKEKIVKPKYETDINEEDIDFDKTQNNNDITKENVTYASTPQTFEDVKSEFEKSKESFASFGTMDISSLFE
jgi:hypothetical protein